MNVVKNKKLYIKRFAMATQELEPMAYKSITKDISLPEHVKIIIITNLSDSLVRIISYALRDEDILEPDRTCMYTVENCFGGGRFIRFRGDPTEGCIVLTCYVQEDANNGSDLQ